jgi:hypothetical protein
MTRRMVSSTVALTTPTPPGFRCGYHDGMFSRGPRDETGPQRYFIEYDALKYHEAGHAVLGYALGFGLTELVLHEDVVSIDDETNSYAIHGLCNGRVEARDEINQLVRRGILNERVVNHALWSAAGPAAERKYNILQKIPPHQLRASEGDHQAISVIRNGLCYRLDPYFDIEEEAWRRAQDALEIDVIWSAVDRLAGELEMPCHDDVPGKYSEVYLGASVRAWLRRWGIRPGMLRSFWPPFETRRARGT